MGGQIQEWKVVRPETASEQGIDQANQRWDVLCVDVLVGAGQGAGHG